MSEAKAREICNAADLSGYSYTDLREADEWIKRYAMAALYKHLKLSGMTVAMRDYVMLMARCHYGSVETDELLKAHHCYPTWMQP